MAQEFLIALGSNLGSTAGDSAQTLAAALRRFPHHGLRLRRLSRFFATPCFPAGAGPDYVNACAAVTLDSPESPDSATTASHTHAAREILHKLHDVEAEFGRERVQRWGARTLDLDLIAAGDTVLPDAETQASWRNLPAAEQTQQTPDQLILPHPRMQERAFVLVPLADIAAGWEHPLMRRNVATLLADLPAALRQEPRAL